METSDKKLNLFFFTILFGFFLSHLEFYCIPLIFEQQLDKT